MAGRKLHPIFNLAFLALFFIITLSINFFHTEDSLQSNHNCPACQFQNSTFATSQINFFHLPQLVLLEALKTLENFHYSHLFFINPTSRSPPAF